MGGRGDRGRKKLSKLQEEVEMAGALEWVQGGELERLAALVLPGPSDLLGQWALAVGSGLSKPQGWTLSWGRAPFALQSQARGNLSFFPSWEGR